MENHFVRITEPTSLAEMVERSKEQPVVLFKHSLSCPISARAYEQLAQFPGEVALLEVQRARELSSEVAKQLGIAHESPQVIVLRNGLVVWNASHFDITAAAVAAAVRETNGGTR